MTSWHLKWSDWIFLVAGVFTLVSIPVIHVFGFPLWALVKIVYVLAIIILLIERRHIYVRH